MSGGRSKMTPTPWTRHRQSLLHYVQAFTPVKWHYRKVVLTCCNTRSTRQHEEWTKGPTLPRGMPEPRTSAKPNTCHGGRQCSTDQVTIRVTLMQIVLIYGMSMWCSALNGKKWN